MNALSSLDSYTLLVVNASSVLLLAVTLFVVMGRQLSAGASGARNTLIVQALGWIALLLSNFWPERQGFAWGYATLVVGAFSLSNWYLFQALSAWLGPRPGRRALLALVVLAPLV